MRVLMIGATGFIGTHITNYLLAHGHTLTLCVRDVKRAKQHYPNQKVLSCDFRKDTDPSIWGSRLDTIDVVINCVGVLHTSPADMQAIHVQTPSALFQACAQRQIKVIHLSALGADAKAPTDYATSKFTAESLLMSMDFHWCILKPSLVYCYGSYGGTSLMRALASLPLFIPIVGDGKQPFSPIHMQDLCEVVKRVVETEAGFQKILNVVGPETIFYQDILIQYRQWLGFKKAKVIHVPATIMKKATVFSRFLFPELPINETSLEMLQYGNCASPDPCIQATGVQPKSIAQSLLLEPSHVQDRWHAKLYFCAPLLKLTLVLIWLMSGLLPLLTEAKVTALSMLNAIPMISHLSTAILYFSCLVDIFLGLGLLFFPQKMKNILLIQAGVVLFYTAFITYFAPHYWLDPFGSVLKNIPVLMCILILFILQDQR